LSEDFELIIRKARTRENYDRLVDIGIRNGTVMEIGDEIKGRTITEINANGGLVTPSLVNPHLHLDKVYSFNLAGEDALKEYQSTSMEGSIRAIELASRVKKNYREDVIYENAKKAVLESLTYGCTAIRAFADVDTMAKLEAIKGILRLRDELRGIMELQVVAFPQEGIVRDPGSEELLLKAVELGADVVGGIPWIEYTEEDTSRHIEIVFRIAEQFDRDIALLTDDAGDPWLKTTEMSVKKVIKDGWIGRTTIHHARAMSLYPETYLRKLLTLIKKSGSSVIVNPHTGPITARVKDMVKEGINVALGQDDIADAYYPFGRGNMIEVAFLASHLLRWLSPSLLDIIYDMITVNAAKAMRLSRYGLCVGCDADLLVFSSRNVYETIWKQEIPQYVIKRGNVIVRNTKESKVFI